MGKTTHSRIILFLIIGLALFITPVFGQTAEQVERLNIIANEFESQFNLQQTEAHRIANSLGFIIRDQADDGRYFELQRIYSGIPLYYQTYNLEGASVINSDKVWSGGGADLNLSGEDQILGIWDAGAVRSSHQELAGRVFQMDGTATFNNHATHVAGTMVASGVNINAKGMSPEAKLHAYDWNNDGSEMALAAANGLTVSQHSYGFITGWAWGSYSGNEGWHWFGNTNISETEDYFFGFYDHFAQNWDMIAHNAPGYLIVKSAGNDRGNGPQTQPVEHYVIENGNWVTSTTVRDLDGGDDGFNSISRNGNAKNILSVGAVETNLDMAWFSGWGPTDDGRIKPDIVAKGVNVYSSLATGDANYASFNGTSMSGPMISGSVGLLKEHYEDLTFEGNVMLSSTMKALIIHGADDMISGTPGPDYRFGWGLMNTQKSADIITRHTDSNGFAIIQERTLNDGGEISLSLTASGDEPLKATIAWNDIPGTPVSPQLNPEDPMLVNDLDLRLTNGVGDMFFPYILDPANPTLAASTGDNFRDNVEMIYIENPGVGEQYTLSITHKGSLEGVNQPVSLVVTGAKSEVIAGLTPPIGLTAHLNESTGDVELNWSFGMGAGFTDDFCGDAPGWLVSDGRMSVEDCYLQVSGNGNEEWVSGYHSSETYDDFILETKVTRIDGATDNSLSLYFRSDGFYEETGDNNAYLVNITADGNYSAWVLENGSVTNLIPWLSSSAINTGLGAANVVTVNANGPDFDIYINGQYVDSFTDATHSSGYAGVGTFDGGSSTHVEWDYVALSTTAMMAQAPGKNVAISAEDIALRNMEVSTDPTRGPERQYRESTATRQHEARGLLSQYITSSGQVSPSATFLNFEVYRNGSTVGTTSETFFTDNLPGLGSYDYEVTTVYAEGESEPAGPVNVEWFSFDYYPLEFTSLELNGGGFDNFTGNGFVGNLTHVIADFVLNDGSNGTWASDLALIVTNTDQPPVDGGGNIVVQVGGATTTIFGSSFIPWGIGNSSTPGTPVTTVIELPEALDINGLYVWIGHGWTNPDATGNWSGEIGLVGITPDEGFIDFSSNIYVSDQGDNSIDLTIGTAADATTGFDEQYDQFAPPPGPSGTFDARIKFTGEDYISFFQPTTTEQTIWPIEVRASSGNTPVTLSWDPGSLAEEGFFVLSNSNGINVNMREESSAEVPGDGYQPLTITHSLNQIITVDYLSGWNLVGLALNQEHDSFTEIFNQAIPGTLFGFDGAYVSKSVLTPGDGYWLRFSENEETTFSGGSIGEVEVDLSEGWNLVSGNAVCNPECGFEDENSIIIPGTLFGFNGSYFLADGLNAGLGYWVRTSQAGSVKISQAIAAKSKKESGPLADIQEDLESSYTRIIAKSGEGAAQHLYFGANSIEMVNEMQFSMPPLPPSGSFDARFSGNYWVSNAVEVMIDLQRRNEPITLTLEPGTRALKAVFEIVEFDDNKELVRYPADPDQPYTLSEQSTQVLISLGDGEFQQELPLEFALEQNYPNPFNPTTQIKYSLPVETDVRLEIFNVMGQRVASLYNGRQIPGYHNISFDASSLSSGVYFYRLHAGSYVHVRKMMLIK